MKEVFGRGTVLFLLRSVYVSRVRQYAKIFCSAHCKQYGIDLTIDSFFSIITVYTEICAVVVIDGYTEAVGARIPAQYQAMQKIEQVVIFKVTVNEDVAQQVRTMETITKGHEGSSLCNSQFHVIHKIAQNPNSTIVTTVFFTLFCLRVRES